MLQNIHHKILIIGGGTAGLTVAARLKRAGESGIAIIEPSEKHFYQPLWTLVGAGCVGKEVTMRNEADYIAAGTTWIKDSACEISPDTKSVATRSGARISYDFLIVAPGLELDWDAIPGLREAVGSGAVSTNYSYDHTAQTWDLIRNFKGGTALFHMPGTPIKCPGAPQKIVYLTADYLERAGMLRSVELKYFVHAPVIFGVPFFARELVKIAERYGVQVHYQHNLVAVDAKANIAHFEIVGGDKQGQRISVPYDMLHVSPPQSPPDEVKSSPLANAAGWVEVNQNSMQHLRHANVFALGDVIGTPNSKTAAAVRKQAPVVARNILRLMKHQEIEGSYDGYASCPLTTARGKAIIAEFIYGGKVTPTLPLLDPGKERWLGWWIKVSFLPMLYWQYMLKGYEWFPGHNTAFEE